MVNWNETPNTGHGYVNTLLCLELLTGLKRALGIGSNTSCAFLLGMTSHTSRFKIYNCLNPKKK